MSTGPDATFKFLTKTENKASLEVLTAGLDSPSPETRSRVLGAMLTRLNPEGHQEVFRRLATFDERCRSIINEHPERLGPVVEASLKNRDEKSCKVACNAIISLRLYDTLPTLTSVLMDTDHPNSALIAETVLTLTDLFYSDLSGSSGRPKRRDLEGLRRRATSSLEDSVRKFQRHGKVEALESFLLVAKPQNPTLRNILRSAADETRQPIVKLLSKSSRGGVIRLLLGFLEDPQMPRVVAKILASRTDKKFVEHMLLAIGPRPTGSIAQTVAQIDSIAWARPGHPILDELDDSAQQAVIGLLVASGIERSKVLEVVGHILAKGKPLGRRTAAEALANFPGPEANALAVKALADEDPQVQACVLKQLRPRKIPGAMLMLIRMVDTSNEVVRQALREAMPEFTVRQFLINFDAMEPELQMTAGHMVRQINPDAQAKLLKEMRGLSPVRRRRAVLAASAMGLIPGIEQTVIGLLSDEDHIVRTAAAKALADCKTMPSWDALRDALLDKSVIVQQAAEQSLERISRSLLTMVEEEAESTEEVTT